MNKAGALPWCAGEVRSLAQRSAEAAKEIKSLITASVERVEQGSALVDKAGATMTEVVTAIRRVTDIMGEISAASSEQSAGVAQVGEAVTQMDQATQQNAALVEEMAAAAASLTPRRGSWSRPWPCSNWRKTQLTAQEHGSVPRQEPAPVLHPAAPCWVPPKQPVRCARQQRRPQSQRPAWLHRVGRPPRPPPAAARIGQGRGG